MKHETIKINDRAELITYCLDDAAELYVKARPGIIIYPGGAYAFCSKREAEQVAITFNGAGFNAFVVYYTCQQGFREAYRDGMEAFRYLQERRKEYHLNHMITCGFSAGAHLAGSISTDPETRPDGMILVYPPLEKNNWEKTCPDCVDVLERIDENTPKTFLVHACDDPVVPVRNTYLLMQKLDEHNVEFEAHVFRSGGHGFSLCNKAVGLNDPSYENDRKSAWVSLCISWIKEGIGDLEFYERKHLSIQDAPKILRESFASFFGNEKAMNIIREAYPGLYEENKDKDTKNFPLAGCLIYTRNVDLLDLNLLAEKLKQAM